MAVDNLREIDYAAIMGHPKVRGAIRPIINTIDWRSPLATDICSHMLTMDPSQTPEPGSVRAVLMLKDYNEDEIDFVLTKIEEYAHIDGGQTDSLIHLFEEFYKKSIVRSALERYHVDKNINELCAKLATVTTSGLGNFNIHDLSLMTYDEFLKEQEHTGAHFIPSAFKVCTESMAHGYYTKGNLVQVAAESGVGKTMFLMNEVVHFARLGIKTLWVALGDMNKDDFMIRLASIIKDVPINEVTLSPDKYKDDEVNEILSHIRVMLYAAEEIDIYTLKTYVTNVVYEFPYDVLVVDYDGNLAESSPGKGMYEEGGIIYNTLAGISRFRENPCLAFVGSQTKIMWWGHEIVPKEASAESSKKQHALDMQITIGIKSDEVCRERKIGTINIPKQRRGETKMMKFQLTTTGRFREISTAEYQMIRSKSDLV